VKVVIAGKTVGRSSRASAERFLARGLRRLEARTRIIGGRDRGSDDRGEFRIEIPDPPRIPDR